MHLRSYGYAFGVRLKKLRLMRELTQEELATKSGLSRNMIVNYERNLSREEKPANPTLDRIYRLAQALQVPVAVLLPCATTAVTDKCQPEETKNLAIDVTWPLTEDDTAPFSPAEVDGDSRLDNHRMPGKPGSTRPAIRHFDVALSTHHNRHQRTPRPHA
ncbi:helix-turn-helix domain-containing protein [Corynebacterium aquilae]|uniref:helix-turn-helix domain-containing protein n=1 Tax=Corynebacterium aquilae TaxID=203263 RepID=UPI0009511884|nr:helix-turn-helix transcriptional regulator [Corynebacterium aquilae]